MTAEVGKSEAIKMNSKKELFDLLKKADRGKNEYLTDLFRNLPEETAKQMIVTEVKKGAYILRAGMPCDMVYFLLSGRVVGEAHQKMGHMYSFMDFSKKDIIGDFESFTDCSEFCASVRAEQDCKLLKLSRKSYLNWIRHDEHALFLRLRTILNTLSSETNIEREWLFMGCKERLVNYLVRLYEREQNTKNGVFRNQKSQSELADKIGFNVRSIQRNITSLKSEGLVSVESGKIVITKEQYEKLKENLR